MEELAFWQGSSNKDAAGDLHHVSKSYIWFYSHEEEKSPFSYLHQDLQAAFWRRADTPTLNNSNFVTKSELSWFTYSAV